MFKCPLCGNSYKEIEDLYLHLEKSHSDMIPQDYSASRYLYQLKTGKTHGTCVMCKKPTEWNERTNKYHRFCNDPKCKEEYREIFKERMIGKHGKVSLLDDPEQQKKMLANRKISGIYVMNGKELPYTGSYELDFLKMLDVLLDWDENDIMAPSPHTYWYVHEGVRRFYIPDFYIPSLNLEVEIKDGGDNPNMHHKIQAVDKEKERLKDEVMKSGTISYIKVVNKQYGGFFTLLAQAKSNFAKGMKEKPIILLESVEIPVVENSSVKMSTINPSQEGFRDEHGLWNSVITKNGKVYRERCEALIMKNGKVYMWIKGEGKYVLPGGSTEPDRTVEQQLFNECREEARINIKNPRYVKTFYKDYTTRPKWMENLPVKYDGLVTHVYVCDFDSKYSGHIDKYDIDEKMIKNGKFYSLDEVKDIIRDEHKFILGDIVTESKLTSKERKNLDEEVFGLPELRKYPLNDKNHIISAMRFFNKCDEEHKPELAKNIKKRIDELGLDIKISDNISSYISKDVTEGIAENNIFLQPVYVLLTYTDSLMAKTIKKVTKQPYSHAGISLDSSLSHIFTYGRKDKGDHCQFTDENIYNGLLGGARDTVQYALYVTFFDNTQIKMLQQQIENIKNDITKHKYSYKGLINIALGRETHDDRMFCSQFVASVIRAGDANRLSRDSSLYTPTDLKKVSGMHFVTRGVLGNYDQVKVDKIVNDIKSKLTIREATDSIIEAAMPIVNRDLLDSQYDIPKFISITKESVDIDVLVNTMNYIDNPLCKPIIAKEIENIIESINSVECENHIEECTENMYLIIEAARNRCTNNKLVIFNPNDKDSRIYTVKENSKDGIRGFETNEYRNNLGKLVCEETNTELPDNNETVSIGFKINANRSTIDIITESFVSAKISPTLYTGVILDTQDSRSLVQYAKSVLESIGVTDIEIERYK